MLALSRANSRGLDGSRDIAVESRLARLTCRARRKLDRAFTSFLLSIALAAPGLPAIAQEQKQAHRTAATELASTSQAERCRSEGA